MANDRQTSVATDPLIDTAGHIADGRPIDWEALGASGGVDLLDDLAIIERIAGAHRKLHTLLPRATEPDTGAVWGPLELVEEVGRGSFGVVYRAIDTRLHREVALKVYQDAATSLSVIDEGRHLARVAHRNVVTVFGADVIDGLAGMWMEFVRGQRLDEIVARSGPMSAREAAGVGEDVARALAAVHSAGLVHRDVKAQNVMREAGGRIVLMDLGASNMVSPSPTTGLTGTPLYIAPELLSGGQPSTASDIYSLGVLLFFLATGTFPVQGRTLADIRSAHARGQRRTITDLRPDIPSAFARVVSRALEEDPARRFNSAGELADALNAVSAGPRRLDVRRWLIPAATAAVVGLLVAASGFLSRAPVKTTGPTSLAVLPMRNLTGDPGKAYLADGLTEVITANLATLPDLRVPSTVATAPFRDAVDPPAVGRKLGVTLLLAGAVTQADKRIRLSVQLLEAESGRIVWGQELLRTPETILSAQSEIAKTVAARLALASSTRRPQNDGPAQSAAAQEEYLRGLVDVNSQIEARVPSGIGHFTRAVELDPSFAAAWAELSLAEVRASESGDWMDRTEKAQLAREHALKALELDPGHPTGYVALASVQYHHDWDFTSADATFRRALDLAPSSAFARMRYAFLLAARGDVPEAIRQASEARNLEPLLPVRSTSVGILKYYARDFPGAMAEMQRAIDLSADAVVGHYGMGRVLLALNRPEEAVAEMQRAAQAAQPNPAYVAGLAYAYASAGRTSDVKTTLSLLDELEQAGRRASIDNRAYVAIAQKRYDDAFELLDEAINRRMTNVLWLNVDPRVDPIRQDPRFPGLLAKLNIRSPQP
jgi:serine/threonine-protein kinase